MKIIFIAGPYTGDGTYQGREKNIREAERYALALSNHQIGFYCPHTNTAHFTSSKGSLAPESFFYDLGIEMVSRCDAALAMPGWQNSPGALREVNHAKRLGLPVFEPASTDDLDEIAAWSQGTE